ncbi:amidohydrolase [Timonella senegalensis]|uniref:amidohydrolase n=1 Tax=Timonella senegalensis TaxID=1465825 RepID=UPI0028AE94C7|nr:amidohydrolase family protein [Timonella senegalensis]
MTSILFHNGYVHSSSDPFAEALFVEDGVITWTGENDTAASFAKRADRVVDLDGALIAPGFVDTHVHLLETALLDEAVDVAPSAGGVTAQAVLDLLAARVELDSAKAADVVADAAPQIVSATGYDDSSWTSEPLTREMLDARFPGVPVYVPRADLHSAIVSSALLVSAGLTDQILDDRGRVSGAIHTPIREFIRELAPERRTELYQAVLAKCAALGIVAVHENAAPGIDTPEGLAELIDMTSSPESGLPQVVGYLGMLVRSVEQVEELRAQVPGLAGLAGDLSVDGSFGSHSAALREPYADAPDTIGTLHLSAQEIEQHLAACSDAGMTAGFHVIGDRALDTVLEAVENLVKRDASYVSKLRRCGHRLEHVELADEASRAELAKYGFMVSVQPAFDAHWGTPGGMYEQRLGSERLCATSPIRDFTRDGIPMGFGSDTPVTVIDPWGGVAAAVFHNNPEQRISARAAFKAHTRGGWRLGGEANFMAGEIRVGAPAHLAIWRAEELGVQAENDGRSSWTTDGRSGSPLLPILSQDGNRPQCLATLRAGVFIYDDLGN